MRRDDWKLNHVGLVVRDWHRPLGYYQSTGLGVSVGPQIVSMDFTSRGPSKFFLNDKLPRLNGGSGPGRPLGPEPEPPPGSKRGTYRFMDMDLQVGDLLLEILRDRQIPFEGITHLCFNVPDVKKETEHLLSKDCEVLLSFTQGDFIAENYVDTRKCGHVIISFRPPVEKWEQAWTEHNLSHPMLSDWRFQGLGIAVRDLDKAVEYYESLEIAEFEPEKMLDVMSGDARVMARTRVGYVGPVAFEIVQPIEGQQIYQESLESRGEGICEMSFTAGDLRAETEKLANSGVAVALSGRLEEGAEFAYFDTRESGGNVVVRLLQRK